MLTVPRNATSGAPARPDRPARRPAAPTRPPLEVVGPRQPRRPVRSRRQLVVMFAGVFAALCVFGVVVAHVGLAQGQFQLEQLRESSAQKQAEYDRLRLQVAQLESPERIVADAQQRLGMVTPPHVSYLAPSADEPPAAPAPSRDPSLASDATTGSRSGWSTVKPHLADG